jgi:hypothetical protein
VKAGTDGFVASVTIKNVGSATIPSSTVKLNITGTQISTSMGSLSPGDTTTLSFSSTLGWNTISTRETVSGALITEAGTLEVVFKVIKSS